MRWGIRRTRKAHSPFSYLNAKRAKHKYARKAKKAIRQEMNNAGYYLSGAHQLQKKQGDIYEHEKRSSKVSNTPMNTSASYIRDYNISNNNARRFYHAYNKIKNTPVNTATARKYKNIYYSAVRGNK